MSSRIQLVVALITAIVLLALIVCVMVIDWMKEVSRSPEHAAKINLIGFLGLAVIEPVVLCFVGVLIMAINIILNTIQ